MDYAQAFIVRFWREPGWKNDKEWRGLVIHVQTGERTSVRSLAEAAQVMATYLSEHAEGEGSDRERRD